MGRQRSDRPVFPDEGGRAVELNRPFDRHQSQGRCATVSVLYIARNRSSSGYTAGHATPPSTTPSRPGSFSVSAASPVRLDCQRAAERAPAVGAGYFAKLLAPEVALLPAGQLVDKPLSVRRAATLSPRRDGPWLAIQGARGTRADAGRPTNRHSVSVMVIVRTVERPGARPAHASWGCPGG